MSAMPSVKTHPIACRVATGVCPHLAQHASRRPEQRIALDNLGIPYDYISTQIIARNLSDLNAEYDVILFPPVGFFSSPTAIINGLPSALGAIRSPWKNTPETPNLVGKNDSTDDMRPGLGWEGGQQIYNPSSQGAAFCGRDRHLAFRAVHRPGRWRQQRARKLKIVGSVVARLVDAASPIAYGYDEKLSAYCDNGPISLSSISGAAAAASAPRCTRVPLAAAPQMIRISPFARRRSPEEPKSEIWENPLLTDEQLRNNFRAIPLRIARVIFRYADSKVARLRTRRRRR